ncbi:CrcB family protein [Streptomyces sp. SM14]|uniref:fluoride efflux transporter FluC n=1 Tax=Streptomyces sp. SM14 TaxID=1736045 RepID=UPI000CD57920|nr:CrcB family protein [Streptomyces sp. SM14]
MNWLAIIAGALVGAPLRYLTDRLLTGRVDGAFPYGTLSVNIVACAGLGAVTGAALPGHLALLLGPGLCATLSTYSTFSYETLRLIETGRAHLAATSTVVAVVAGTAAAMAGAALGGTLTG